MFPLDHEFAVDLSTHYIMLTRSYKLGLVLVNPNITFTAGWPGDAIEAIRRT